MTRRIILASTSRASTYLSRSTSSMASGEPNAVANSIAAQAAAAQTPHFLYVAASIIDGRSWCGDCRTAEPLIQKHFPGGSGSGSGQPRRLTVQHAGDPAA